MVFSEMIASLEEEVKPAENIENVDGEISIVFWSFAFVLLLIITIWFYITEIAPMRRAVGKVDLIDKEEEVAKRILEHLSDDLRLTGDNSKDKISENKSLVYNAQKEDSSVYEYVDDEIHIHYSQYAWDDGNSKLDSTELPTSREPGRRHSMENMDLIFPGHLPSIVEEEEEHDEGIGEENIEKFAVANMIVTDIRAGTKVADASILHTSNVNNDSGGIEPIARKANDYSRREANIRISREGQESAEKYSSAIQGRGNIALPSERHDSQYASVHRVKNTRSDRSLQKVSKPATSGTSLLTQSKESFSQKEDVGKDASQESLCHSREQESVIPVECENVTESTSGSFGEKDLDVSSKQDFSLKFNDLESEKHSKVSHSNHDLAASFKPDANESENVVKICISNSQEIFCPPENGPDQHSTRDSSSLYSTYEENGCEKNATSPLTKRVNTHDDTKRFADVDEEVDNGKFGELVLSGSGDDRVDFNNTTHAWTFFSMSGCDESEGKKMDEKRPLHQENIPTIIIDTFENGLQSDKLVVSEESTMSGDERTLHYGEFETDIDIDDIDLIDSDELENEGEFSVYFKKHVSVTDLDKILSEEGQNDTSGSDPSKILERDLSTDERNLEQTAVVNIFEISLDEETIRSRTVQEGTKTIEDTSELDIQGSVIVSKKLTDCLDNPPISDEDLDEADPWADNSPPKSYTVESLFDDVSFQKDGIYGELLLSKLNENDISDENSYDSLSDDEDWHEFSEELKRERRGFLFTIPEDEEIGLPEVNLRRGDSFGGARHNPIFDNELNVKENTQQEQLLKAPIATMDTYDSDFDLDEIEESDSSESPHIDESKNADGLTSESIKTFILGDTMIENGEHDARKDESLTESSVTGEIANAGEPSLGAPVMKHDEGPTTLVEVPVESELASVEDWKINGSVTENGRHDVASVFAKNGRFMPDESKSDSDAVEKIANADDPSLAMQQNGSKMVCEESIMPEEIATVRSSKMNDGVTESFCCDDESVVEDERQVSDLSHHAVAAQHKELDDFDIKTQEIMESKIVKTSKVSDSVTEKSTHDEEGVVTELAERETSEKRETEKIATTKEPNVSPDSTQAVKIVKEIKLFIRKEVNGIKEDNTLKEGSPTKSKEAIEVTGKEKTAATDGIHSREEKEENIALVNRDSVKHYPPNVVSSKIDPAYQYVEPVTKENVVIDMSELNAVNMNATTKREKPLSSKPQPKLVTDEMKESLSRKNADIMPSVTQLPALNLKEEVKANLEKTEPCLILPCVSPVNENSPGSDLTLSTAQNKETEVNTEIDSTEVLEKGTAQSCNSSSKIDPAYQYVEPVTKQNVVIDMNELNAVNMNATTKREKPLSSKPQPKLVTDEMKESLSRKDADILPSVTQLPALNLKEEVKANLEKTEPCLILPCVSPVNENSLGSDLTLSTAQDKETEVNTEIDSTEVLEKGTAQSCNSPSKGSNITCDEHDLHVSSPKGDYLGTKSIQNPTTECIVEADKANNNTKTELRTVTVPSESTSHATAGHKSEENVKNQIKADTDGCKQYKVSSETKLQNSKHVLNSNKQKEVDTRSKLELVASRSLISKTDTTEILPQVDDQNNTLKMSDKEESGIAKKSMKARLSASHFKTDPKVGDISENSVKALAKEAKVSRVSSLVRRIEGRTRSLSSKEIAPETRKTNVFAQRYLQKTEAKLSTIKQEQTKPDWLVDLKTSDSSKRSEVDHRSEELSSGKTNHEKLAAESSSVSIGVKGKDSQDDQERPRKTYLSSFNIRLTKSHEDLRFSERSHENLQESIMEEEWPDVESSDTDRSQTPTTPGEVIESFEPPSIHTAKITVQEVVGDKQRIVILNVNKKIQGRARWKSLNDLDSLNMALTPPRRTSDVGTGLACFAEEEEKMGENECSSHPRVVPIVKTKSRPDRDSLPETRQPKQLRKSSIVSVTPLESRETVKENETQLRVEKDQVEPVLQQKSLTNGYAVSEIEEQRSLPRILPIIKATPVEKREYLNRNKSESEAVKVTVPCMSREIPSSSTRFAKEDFKDRESLVTAGKTERDDGKETILNRVTRVHDLSNSVGVISRLELESRTKIRDENTIGKAMKVHVSRRMEEGCVQPEVSLSEKAKTQKDSAVSALISSKVQQKRLQDGECGYESVGVSRVVSSDSRVNRVFVPEGANERSVSSLSSLDDDEEVEMLGESTVMVTDLDALLAQQFSLTPEETESNTSEVGKQESKEEAHILASMKLAPERTPRISLGGDADSVVIRHSKQEEPIVVKPIIMTGTSEPDEVQPVQVISAFLVNDEYDDDELDEVFVEEYTPYNDHESTNDSCRSYSSDADSETSSVSSIPLKQQHRHTRGSLEASNPGVRNRNESSGSSRSATPVAELEVEHPLIPLEVSKLENKTGEFSPEESPVSYSSEQIRPPRSGKTTEYSSAFTPVSRTADARRLRARSHGNESDEERIVAKKGLAASVQDVKSVPGLRIDTERFKEAADSRKSMPDLSGRKEQAMDESPYLRGLSAHTRRWLSQNMWMDPSAKQAEKDLMTSDLFLYPSNRFQPGSDIDASFLSLANDRDFRDDISVSTLSTRPQSPMSEFSFAGETPIWGLRRGSTTVIKCANPRCGREEVLFGGEKTTYTSCPACFTYYCTRACRRIHWSEHKKVCFFGRINSYIRSFIYLCHKKEALKFQLCKTANDGHKKKGRGSVMVTFASAQSARKFMTSGCTFFPSPPTYSSLIDLQAEGVISKHKVTLLQNIKDYEPEEEFVLNLAIVAGKMEDLPANPIPRRKVSTVLQVVKIPLSSQLKKTAPSSNLPGDANTEVKVFYLPKCARHEFVNDSEARRHYCRNISKNLKQYGIRLKHDYPDVYGKLCLYVDQNVPFTEPLTVYGNQGKKIVMCKIMPETGGETKA
ncbi:uncharacterized protein LOC114977744 isoform X1 [Acropora millepora]|uniref:uncharacterized protein LOC114977744 isoform X1 n=1 Tax=Acropora millepora TaxID=45264 RepID=UPI001CF2DA41|nr:uncharacterized protein LOC114977744 isoform X1 [Acropora millepora]